LIFAFYAGRNYNFCFVNFVQKIENHTDIEGKKDYSIFLFIYAERKFFLHSLVRYLVKLPESCKINRVVENGFSTFVLCCFQTLKTLMSANQVILSRKNDTFNRLLGPKSTFYRLFGLKNRLNPTFRAQKAGTL